MVWVYVMIMCSILWCGCMSCGMVAWSGYILWYGCTLWCGYMLLSCAMAIWQGCMLWVHHMGIWVYAYMSIGEYFMRIHHVCIYGTGVSCGYMLCFCVMVYVSYGVCIVCRGPVCEEGRDRSVTNPNFTLNKKENYTLYTYVFWYVPDHRCMRIYIRIRVCIHDIYTYVYGYIYIHICIHICIYILYIRTCISVPVYLIYLLRAANSYTALVGFRV